VFSCFLSFFLFFLLLSVVCFCPFSFSYAPSHALADV
jgi:hypothetical protein